MRISAKNGLKKIIGIDLENEFIIEFFFFPFGLRMRFWKELIDSKKLKMSDRICKRNSNILKK